MRPAFWGSKLGSAEWLPSAKYQGKRPHFSGSMELTYENGFLTLREPPMRRSQSLPSISTPGCILAKEMEAATREDVQRLGAQLGFNAPKPLSCARGFQNPEFCPCRQCRSTGAMVQFDKKQREAFRSMHREEILLLLLNQLAARATMKGLARAVVPILQTISAVTRPLNALNVRSVSPSRYNNLARYLSKLQCDKMIKTAFSFAGINVSAFPGLRQQLCAVRFVRASANP